MPILKYIQYEWFKQKYRSTRFMQVFACSVVLFATVVLADSPRFSPVTPDYVLTFPHDYGAHPDFRIEWWYVTGWLETVDKEPLGFQITFFRSATGHNPDNPSRFAPKQLIIAHMALSDPDKGKVLYEQRSAREGFELSYARLGNTDIKLDDWRFVREIDGGYQVNMQAADFSLDLSLAPTQAMILQGDKGFSRKGPTLAQASYYYSEPHLNVAGTIFHHNQPVTVSGRAWLDHEWSSELLDAEAVGWDWVGANLADGSAFMAFQIRHKNGTQLWAQAILRDASGHVTQFKPEQIEFVPVRTWRSPYTEAIYPVVMRVHTDTAEWLLTPLLDDQELDSRQSIGAAYWEGAVTLTRDGQFAGQGYLELTGYADSLNLNR
ncbi:Predicted secreted hydrolase [Nitrosomonas cryotolerans]|uniref:Predicted secreted hydrolase n=1 Tax=Nitrosomonas cryotolerans ATCC 49181 TaxID=1131553 RepID=A0A1N6GIV3_9PROT|nr:Predicted secreted hydrolase [Nitrosomonas cryotolerans]SIO07440.1 Predicted secreted hydrolase [Nitrosomonas cryotolerans ATCC 49181]